MAREYGTVSITFWDDPDARRLGQDAAFLYLYFRTCKHATAANAYQIPMDYIRRDTQLPQERITKAIQALSIKPFVLYDTATEVLFMPGVYQEKGNRVANPNVAKYATTLILGLPNCRLKVQALEDLKACCNFASVVDAALAGWQFEATQPSLPLTLPALPAPPVEPPRPVKRRSETVPTRLDPNWLPSAQDRAYGTSRGISDHDLGIIADSYRRYFLSDTCPKPTKKNWYLTWCNWIDREALNRSQRKGGNGAHPGSNGNGGHAPERSSWTTRMAEYRKTKVWSSMWGPPPGSPGCKVPPEHLAPPPQD